MAPSPVKEAACDKYCKGEKAEVKCEDYDFDSVKLTECQMACLECAKPLKACYCPKLLTLRITKTTTKPEHESSDGYLTLYIVLGVVILILIVLIGVWYWWKATKRKKDNKPASDSVMPEDSVPVTSTEDSVQDETQDEKSPPKSPK